MNLWTEECKHLLQKNTITTNIRLHDSSFCTLTEKEEEEEVVVVAVVVVVNH
jgi:hypothetical protein